MTTPPTAAEVEAWADGAGIGSEQVQSIVGYSGIGGGEALASLFLYGYTQNDGTQAFGALTADPTSNPAAAFTLQGIVAIYGAVTVREYVPVLAPLPVAVGPWAADATEQTRVNAPANWVPVP